MEPSDLNQSKEEKFLRTEIRKLFDDRVEKAARENADLINDPFTGGMIIQSAISTIYQQLKEDPMFHLLAAGADFDYEKIFDEECKAALSKYLNY
ncbi:MAG: hypothetical protein IKZ99_01700 [Salinivirgaceae bacterium]|nr:hypothetical protein [Salinivirgaceae bacterium]